MDIVIEIATCDAHLDLKLAAVFPTLFQCSAFPSMRRRFRADLASQGALSILRKTGQPMGACHAAERVWEMAMHFSADGFVATLKSRWHFHFPRAQR